MIAARYRLPEGPPLITMPRDVDETVAAWARAGRLAAPGRPSCRAQQPPPRRSRWLRRRSS